MDGLVKSYGGKPAVDHLSFEVKRGEIFALLGPNGAGKTTTIEILEGYRGPDEGRVQVLGLDPFAQGRRLRPRIGAMLQEGGLYPAISARDALRLFATFYEHPRAAGDLLRLVGLEDAAGTRYRRLSGGQKQRLSLALAIVGNPELVFLDEPTAGLDPQARRATWDLIRSLQSDGVTVLLSTHYIEEAERLADRVAILERGRLVASGSPRALVQVDRCKVRLRTSAAIETDALLALPCCRKVESPDACHYVLHTDDVPEMLVQVTVYLRDVDVGITDIGVGQGTLEDVFLQLTGRQFDS
ncbi:MAG: ABC transporter ATP-binding protein [Chloroflexota bacterium]